MKGHRAIRYGFVQGAGLLASDRPDEIDACVCRDAASRTGAGDRLI